MPKNKQRTSNKRINTTPISKRGKGHHSYEEIASCTVKQSQIINLSLVDQQAFVNALLNPPEPSAALKRAVERYKKLGL